VGVRTDCFVSGDAFDRLFAVGSTLLTVVGNGFFLAALDVGGLGFYLHGFLHRLGHLAPLVDGNGAAALVRLLHLHAERRERDEEEEEGAYETEIACSIVSEETLRPEQRSSLTPQMAPRILICHRDVVRARHGQRARRAPLYGARLVLRLRAGHLRHDVRWHALDLEVVVLVGEQRLEAVLHGVDPAQPGEPRMHLAGRD